MNIDELIKNIKEETKGFSELEIIRYVYIKLGTEMHFDTNFQFGSEKSRVLIYKNCFYNKETLDEYLIDKIIICKSIAQLLEYILKELNINITTFISNDEFNNYPHVYNIITLKNGNTISIDLQSDLDKIQANLRTNHFGLKVNNVSRDITLKELEEIDMKIGYISQENYYADDYYYLVKNVLDGLATIEEKLEFLLNNIAPYDKYKDMEYVELKKYLKKQVALYFKYEELKNIKVVDMCYFDDFEKNYTICFMINYASAKRKIYYYSLENKKFISISTNDFNELLENGFSPVEKLPKLR